MASHTTMKKTAFIFDFDGVIADTESVFAQFDCDLLNDVLQQAGIPPSLTPEYIRTLAGNNDAGKLAIIERKFDVDLRAFKDDFISERTEQRKDLFKNQKPNFARSLFSFFETYNDRCAIATNKLKAKIDPDLKAMGLSDLCPIIITSDPPLKKKPAPDMLLAAANCLGAEAQDCFYVGDNTLDMVAAQNAKMRPIGFIIEGIDNEPERAKQLKDAGAEFLIDDFAALIPYVDNHD